MYANAYVRIALIALLGLAAVYSPPFGGWPFSLDGWLWTGVRDWVRDRYWRLPIGAAALMIAADLAASFCPPLRIRVRRAALWSLGLAVGGGIVFLTLRVHHWFGDLVGIDKMPLPWWTIEAAEPLGAFTWSYVEHAAAWLGSSRATAHALVSVAVGALALPALFRWAREITPEWPLPLAMMLSCGFMVIFYGYPEKGTPKSLALTIWYVSVTTTALRQRSAGLAAVSSLLLALAILMHGSVLCLLPAHAWYVWRGGGSAVAAAGIAGFLLPFVIIADYVAGGAPLAGGAWGNIAAPWQWFKKYCISNCGYDFWSFGHGIDIVNSLLALAPVGLLCWPEAIWRSREPIARWLALASLGCLFLSATWFPVYGYLPDWDIFAITPMLIAFHAIFIGATQMDERSFRRLAAAWIVGSGAHAFSWWRYYQVVQ